MKSTLLALTLTGMFIGATGLAQAQDVPVRKEVQQGRIADGVKNGSLTPNETKNLERREAGINRQTRRDRKANGGSLKPGQKAQVTRRQNRVSRSIYRDKHNAAKQTK